MKWYNWLYVSCWALTGLAWGAQDAKADNPFAVNAQSALVINATTNEVVVNKNAESIRPIASITKLMTAIITLDAKLSPDELITISQEDIDATMLRGRPSGGSLPVGTTKTRSELLHLMLMNSQNRAAAALARTYPGGFDVFVASMNTKAQVIGMVDTHFVDPTGLFAQNVSTAQDLAVMVRYASAYDMIQQLSTDTQMTTTVHYGTKDKIAQFGTTNRLLKTSGWDIGLQKTGYISAAGRCLVMLTTVADNPFIVVLLNTSSPYNRAADAIKIKSWIETGSVATKTQVASLNPYKTISKRHKKKRHHKHNHR